VLNIFIINFKLHLRIYFSGMGNKTKKGLQVFIFIILLLPLVQQNFAFITYVGLKGYIDYAPDVTFSWEKWWEGTYQPGKSKYCNDWIGFRPDLIRTNNQLEFSLFRQINYGGTVLGLDNCLYFENYIDAYNGLDYRGDSAIRERLWKLKAINDTFSRLGKSLVLVHAPNKAYFYSEDIPEPYKGQKMEHTNLQSYLRIGDSLGINQIDLNDWFASMKNSSKELLMSKQGTHWTNYGAFIGGDSIVRYIEKLRNINMPHPVVSGIRHTKNPTNPDADINDLANLIVPVTDETFSYPIFKYDDNDTTKKKPRVIFIGDSFVINMIKNWTLQGATADWQFWFYFKFVMNKDYNIGNPEGPQIANYDWKSEMNKTDCIILMCVSVALPHLGDGFIEQAYDYYYPKEQVSKHSLPRNND
jgi:hypothetical protein